MSQAEIYRKLPALFGMWFTLILEPKLRATPQSGRNVREAKTLATLADQLVQGETMRGLMTVLGRLKAITHVATDEEATWRSTELHELVSADSTGLLTRRDRANAAATQREQLRLQTAGRGGALPPTA